MTESFDGWLATDGPVAIFLKEYLEPVQGPEGVIFPPTFAPFAKDDVPAYVIDGEGDNAVAIIDTVGSQANRIEPIFKVEPYSKLVPKALIKVGGREISLLDAGHRGADALVRFSSKRADFATAFQELSSTGIASKLAKLAPTSLVFGVWDSRGSQVKVPRLIGSTVRAFGVRRLSRSAQYSSVFEKEDTEELKTAYGQDFLSSEGLSDAPAGKSAGGVVATNGVIREAILNLVALRAISAGEPAATKTLQRYILGLGLVALMAPFQSYLREGCLLVSAQGKAGECKIVRRDGVREELKLDAPGALRYALAAAEGFGVGADWEAEFESRVVTDAAKAKAEKAKAKKTKP